MERMERYTMSQMSCSLFRFPDLDFAGCARSEVLQVKSGSKTMWAALDHRDGGFLVIFPRWDDTQPLIFCRESSHL